MKANGLKIWSIKHLPFLGKYKRRAVALKAALAPIRDTYAQKREDVVLLELLRDCKTSVSVDYIDVGANHPTDISNTYLLHRNNYRGFLIEPNPELCDLLRAFRPNDKVLNIGIGSDAAVVPFFISRTPVGSSFDEAHFHARKQILDRVAYVPVMSLDQAFSALGVQSIGILSIDVEGWNLRVVETAKAVIARTQILCIEYDTPDERASILALIPDFELITDNGCNLIMKRPL